MDDENECRMSPENSTGSPSPNETSLAEDNNNDEEENEECENDIDTNDNETPENTNEAEHESARESDAGDKDKPKPAQKTAFVELNEAVKRQERVLIPTEAHPNFNFLGRLLGHGGNVLKRLEEQTRCKFSIKGRGSIKNKSQEDELRKSDDPKYAHLKEPLHVEINVLATPCQAHARLALALAELSSFLVPDETVNRNQMAYLNNIAPLAATGRGGMPPRGREPRRMPRGIFHRGRGGYERRGSIRQHPYPPQY